MTKNGEVATVFFSVQGTGGRSTGPYLENRVGDQDIGSPGRPVSFGLQVPGEPEHGRAMYLLIYDLFTVTVSNSAYKYSVAW